MLLYQVAIDSPGGDTSNSKMSELGYYKHVHYKLALMCAKNRIIILCSLLDIRENDTLALMCAKNCVNIFGSFLDIQQNAEWPRFLDHRYFVPKNFCRIAKFGEDILNHGLRPSYYKWKQWHDFKILAPL